MSPDNHYEIAIVGGGIVGLALAYSYAKRKKRIILFERHPKAIGASIRNFGMVWPIGQPNGRFQTAMQSRFTWMELSEKAGFWLRPWGSLHLAYQEDELHVLEEFVGIAKTTGYQCAMLTPEQTIAKSKAVNPVGLEGAMWSATEVNVDPRQAISSIHGYLAKAMGVHIEYNTVISRIDAPTVYAGAHCWKADQIFVCTGADFETLYPESFQQSGLTKCKLQMLRTVPQPNQWELGPNLAAGLTLQHYASFAICESLEPLKKRIAKEMSEYNKWGIHVMLSQTHLGELTIGDSHEYGLDLSPFDQSFINELILKYLKRFVKIPEFAIKECWNGIYAKHPQQSEYVCNVSPGVTIVNGLGGAGMTMSFGLAEKLVDAYI